jgi:hypothetical protein
VLILHSLFAAHMAHLWQTSSLFWFLNFVSIFPVIFVLLEFFLCLTYLFSLSLRNSSPCLSYLIFLFVFFTSTHSISRRGAPLTFTAVRFLKPSLAYLRYVLLLISFGLQFGIEIFSHLALQFLGCTRLGLKTLICTGVLLYCCIVVFPDSLCRSDQISVDTGWMVSASNKISLQIGATC